MAGTQTPKTATCKSCRATLTSPRSIARGRGDRCERLHRQAVRREDARIAAIEETANVIDLSVFRDAKAARDKAAQILIDRSLLPTRVPNQYLAVASGGDQTYLVDTFENTCTCKGFGHHGRCSHLIAAYIREILDTPARPAALIAA